MIEWRADLAGRAAEDRLKDSPANGTSTTVTELMNRS